MLKTISACVFAMLAFFLMTSTAHAQETFDKRTLFTFDQPVALPGVTLPPGTYEFRLANPTGDRRIVQVTNPERTRVFATLMTRPVQRDDIPDEPDLRFIELPAHMADAVQAWWYPGSRHGWEFVYPAEQAARFAEAQREVTRPADVNTDDDRQ